jgi:hypothetical protein
LNLSSRRRDAAQPSSWILTGTNSGFTNESKKSEVESRKLPAAKRSELMISKCAS